MRVLGWGGGEISPILPATASLGGGDASDEAAFLAMAATGGLGRVEDGTDAGLAVAVHATDEWAAIAAACAPGLPASDEAYLLRWSTGTGGRHFLDVFAPAAAGRRQAFRTACQFLAIATPPTRELLVADAPSTPMRGVIETYYGPPWKAEDRLALMPLLAAMKFNLFVYASKIDPWLNWIDTYWKDGWPAEYLADLRAMTAGVHAAGLAAGLQVRPLASVVFSSEDDRALFVEAVLELLDTGFTLFSLSFDDTDQVLLPADQEKYASHDEAMVDFAADVLARLHERRPDVAMGFVPTDYWSRAEGAEESLTLAGERLPPYVTVGWTGREILSPTVVPADADEVGAWLQRKPLLGDNYPVIDNAGERLFLGPVEGRSPDLPGHLAGLLFNPMPFPFASLPALATCADYAWNAPGYDPDRSMIAAGALLAGPNDGATALRVLAEVNRSPFLAGSMAPGLQEAIDAFWAAFDEGIDVQGSSAMLESGFLSVFSGLPTGWAKVALVSLREELLPWVQVLAREGDAGSLALDLLETLASGGQADADLLGDLQAQVQVIRDAKVRPAGSIPLDFLDRALAELQPVPR